METIKIKESELKKMISESVESVINEFVQRGHKICLDKYCLWYMVPDGNGEFDVYDDGEWEGKYCGSLERLQSMSEDEALDYVLAGL